MQSFIAFLLSNFTLTFLILGLIASGISLLRKARPLNRTVIVEALFSYFLLFAMGLSFFYNFVMHVFFGEMAAHFIGWSQSPFQAEVGFASLGFSVVAIIAFRGSFPLRAAAIIGPAFFFWGAGIGHIYQMITAHNFAPGNAGIMFWTDVFFPVIGFILLGLQAKLRPSH